MGRSPGLPIDSIGNTSGTSNWQGFVGDGAVYCSNPVELMNYDIGFHDFIGIGSHASLPGIASNSSLRGNGGLNQLDEMYSQFHPDVPQNFMANKCAGTTNNGVRFTNLSSQGNRSSDNLLQSLMRLPPMAICNGIENGSLFANGYVTPHLYAQESNYRMEPNFACSTPLDPNYYVDSTHRHSSSNNSSLSETLQDGFPVPYQPRYVYVDPPSNIRSSCLLAPPTPQPANRSYPYSQTMNLSRDPNEVVLDELVASSASYFSQFAPATPRPAKIADNYQLLPAQNLSLDQVQNQDNDVRKDILVAPTQNESLDHDCQEIIQNVQETSSAAISASVKERNGLENQENEIINLNKTPSVKTPRRRKHRPKVIVENKRPRTRKPAEAKPKEKASADGIPVPKRKYVRKNKSNAINDGNKTNDSTSEPVSNSCRRSLNFDRQDIIDTANLVEQQETQYETQEHVSYNVIAQEAGTISSQRNGDWNGHVQGNREEGTTTSLYPRMHEIQKDVFQHSNRHLRGAHLVTTEQHIKKSQMSTSDEAKRAANLYRTTLNSYDLPARQPLFLGEDQTRIQEITALEKLERTRQMIVQKQQQRVSECIQSRGCKRYYGLTQEHENSIHSANLISSQVNILQDLQERVIDQCYSGTPKRNKTDYPCHTSSSIQYSARLAEKSSGQVLIGRPENHLIEVNSELFNSPSKLNADPAYPCNKQTVSSKASLRQEQPAEKDRASALAHVVNSLSAQAYPNMQNQMLAIEGFTRSQSLVTVPAKRVKHAIESVKKQNPAENNTGSRVKQKHQQMVSVDDIIDQLKCLNLNSANDEQKALVLYKSDGTIIPYEGFDPLKRRKPRPKVDLDPETNRLWKLLMGKELTDDEKQTDEQKTKWWEEQRSVFRGRADSFIARMHLVQGDRRFSPWKGSVVDSVIGVFLTQNVTDHLSSSAFMSLAARFPLHSLRTVASGNHKPDVLVEEPEICIIQTNEEIQKLASVDHIQQSVTEKYWRLEEIIPSQDSAEYPIVHMNGAVPSLITSDSTADSQINGFQTTVGYKTSFITEETENFIRFPDITSQEIRSSYYKTAIDRHVQLQNADSNKKTKLDGVNSNGMRTVSHSFDLNSPLLQDSTISSTNVQFPTVGGLGMREIDGSYMLGNHNHMYFHQRAASEDMVVPSKSDKQPLHRQSKMVEDASTYNLSEPISSLGKSISTAEKGVIVQNNVESNLKKQDCSSMEATNRTKTNVSKVKDGKAKGEHTTFDWDCLRRQVKSNRNSRERSQDTMDSMDYETIRNADVHEISEAIRERGMNNMLADRMKDFLNRVVRDHGSIDLEWLREAPPDKVKDYLLSIRGLGLKSVECIRLLTLHQHAFPVDTNVGRIAVRLGWVPLQPLPESLQLHLLEMYPVLETIQKYLWPRLCNLDQRTLYELHYQLITFGKVFCTKSKPNCNACPMRGECRHFASAFASSRLALPGPEEKSIVPSDIPFEASQSPTIVVSPMPLHTLQDVPLGEAALTHKACEPIVEEPTTPEQDIAEFSETDIEDTLYEESDEIPTIRLDVEEFTQNLQNFMQENLELQEFDMSKALVALNPRAASIPTPKLKNVNRLRTEHQVYQLPDSHPLLKELDNREPDDPSPYLLAIWTPGETAYSIQPPEGTCSFQESGGLCNESTCFSCNSIRESNSQTVRGTILIPCRTAMRGSFPLNGTYFQVNEVFADHESSLKPIDVPRAWIWNLPRRTVYFGTSVTTIFKGMSTEDIQYCFWRGFVCVRGFDHKTRIPRPLMARLHFPASKLVRGKKEEKNTK